MSLSLTALQGVLAQSTNMVFLECLTISHPDFVGSPSGDILVVNDKADLVRTAGTFTAFPFTVTGMNQQQGTLPKLQIMIDNVDQRVVYALRSIAGTRDDITITYEVVLGSSPNTVEYGPLDFRVSNVSVNTESIGLQLEYHSGFLNDAFPNRLFSPSNAG